MCFEFEIPNKKKDKNLNTIDSELEVEPELEKVRRAGYSVSKLKSFFNLYLLSGTTKSGNRIMCLDIFFNHLSNRPKSDLADVKGQFF